LHEFHPLGIERCRRPLFVDGDRCGNAERRNGGADPAQEAVGDRRRDLLVFMTDFEPDLRPGRNDVG
jgi:hypothetical protein